MATEKDTLSDVLNLPILQLHHFRSDVVSLILILRLHLLSYTIEFVQILLPVLLLLLFFCSCYHLGDSMYRTEEQIRWEALLQGAINHYFPFYHPIISTHSPEFQPIFLTLEKQVSFLY